MHRYLSAHWLINERPSINSRANWDAIGAVGEILGAVYLSTQIRIQNRESKLSTINNLTEQWNALFFGTAL